MKTFGLALLQCLWLALAVVAVVYGGSAENLYCFVEVATAVVILGATLVTLGTVDDDCRLLRAGRGIKSALPPQPSKWEERVSVASLGAQIALCASQAWYWVAGALCIQLFCSVLLRRAAADLRKAHMDWRLRATKGGE